MKKIILIFIFASNSIMLCAQDIFQLQFPEFRPEPIFTIYYNSGNIFLGGAFGLILRSTNSGVNWYNTGSDINSDVVISSWKNLTTGLLCTSDSSLYKSINSGTNWSKVLKFPFRVNDMKISGDLAIVCSYNLVGKSYNAGTNWIILNPDSSSVNQYTACYLADDITGYIAGIDALSTYTLIYKTSDSGNHWAKYNTTIDNFIIKEIFFKNSITGWATGNRYGNICLIKTTNAGFTWFEQYLPQLNSEAIGLYFKDLNTGYITTDSRILKTTDGGYYWSTLIQHYGITSSFLNDSNLFISDSKGKFIRVSSELSIDTILGKNNFRFDKLITASYLNLMVTGNDYNNFRSTNGGLNWVKDYQSTSLQIKNFSFADSYTGYAIAGRGKIIKTSDFGNSWQVLMDSTIELVNLFVLNPNISWVTGNGIILKTTNGGANWDKYSVDGEINKIWFANELTGYSILNDSMRKTTNGGITWTQQQNEHTIDFSFINPSTGWTLNSSDTITELRKTTNGGGNYSLSTRFNGNILKLQFLNLLVGYLSDNNYIIRTADGGNTWEKMRYPKSKYIKINSFSFCDENTGWFCGDNGIILKTNSGGSIIVRENPNYQNNNILIKNSPNPTNGKTRIEYLLSENGVVKIKIYNILGQEVFYYNNDNAIKGTHQILFETDKLWSGIYFILLQNNNYICVNKMVVIK